MSDEAKLAPKSLLTTGDQKRLYEEEMGQDALARQVHLANVAAGRCSCEPRSVKRRWEGSDKPTTRRVHAQSCSKWKKWMAEAEPSV